MAKNGRIQLAELGKRLISELGEPKAVIFEMGQGAEGLRKDFPGLEGRNVNERAGGGALDGEHEIDGGGDGAGAAEGALFVVVVQDDYGGLEALGELAQVGKDGQDGGDVVFVAPTDDIDQGVDDDELGAEQAGVAGEIVDIQDIVKVIGAGGDEMEGSAFGGLVAGERGIGALPEAVEAGFFVDVEDGRLGNGQPQPGLAEGDADGKIEGEEGFFAAGVADDEVEAGAREEALDTPEDGGRRLEGDVCGMDDANEARRVRVLAGGTGWHARIKAGKRKLRLRGSEMSRGWTIYSLDCNRAISGEKDLAAGESPIEGLSSSAKYPVTMAIVADVCIGFMEGKWQYQIPNRQNILFH